ncbi:hypothetical protein C2S51_029513 [Perilla frutescens var. frutescens]|nr:hypothetical protein C2S51_029513 [Perilla frutescens var. frutescens]
MTSLVSSNENNSGGSNNADNIDDHHSLHLFCQPQKVSFGNLKELQTLRNPFSCGHTIDASLFIRLEKLTIDGFKGSMGLFTFSIAGNLVNLRELRIRSCDELVEVIKDEEDHKVVSGDGQRTLLIPKLQELQLSRLPKLVSICEWKCDVELPSLRKVEILRGILSLFTSSTAENLVSLRELSIGYCDQMVKVIEDKEAKEEEKLVISAAAERTTLLFPKLQKLQLWFLPKLVSFCEWKCDVEFPSLREVEIQSCPNMKHFTLGLLTTPNLEVVRIYWESNLEVVRINREDFGGLKDLNGVVQRQFEVTKNT